MKPRQLGDFFRHGFREIVLLGDVFAQIEDADFSFFADKLPVAGTYGPPAFVTAGGPERGERSKTCLIS